METKYYTVTKTWGKPTTTSTGRLFLQNTWSRPIRYAWTPTDSSPTSTDDGHELLTSDVAERGGGVTCFLWVKYTGSQAETDGVVAYSE